MNIAWFLIGFFCLLLEISSPGLFYFLALACGSFASFFASMIGRSLYEQYLLFFLISVITILLLHFFVKDLLLGKKGYRSNVDQLIGKTVKITAVKSKRAGFGKVGGETWSVKLADQGELKVGMKATVIDVQGCHLFVKRS